MIEKLEKLANLSAAADDLNVIAIPGQNSIIDTVDQTTGRTRINGRTLEEVQQREPGAVLMSFESWRAAAAERQNTPITWSRVTRHQYSDALEVLPPIDFDGRNFLVGEPYDHSFTTGAPRFVAYREIAGVYVVSSRPMTRVEFRAAIRGQRIKS